MGYGAASLACPLVASVLFALAMEKLLAEDTLEHPLLDIKDIKSDTCLKCHPTKNDAKFVHSAVRMGCENCHEAATENNKTTITLAATGGDLCAKCHEANKDPVQHEPAKAGQCLICHDPHTGDYKAQTRAEVNTLCLSCHGVGQTNVKVNPETKLVAVLGRQIISLDEYSQAPKLAEGHSENNMASMASDPAIVKEPGKPDAEPNCLFCHDPHASKAEHLLRRAADGGAAENLSLGYPGDFRRVNQGPQNVPVLRGPCLGGRG
jgi:predicted CXXCH cytochrome family protein